MRDMTQERMQDLQRFKHGGMEPEWLVEDALRGPVQRVPRADATMTCNCGRTFRFDEFDAWSEHPCSAAVEP